MRLPTMSLTAAMLAVVLAAADLAVVQWVHGPKEVGNRLGLVLSLLPMANILPFLGLTLATTKSGKRPFIAGFFACGLAAMLAHVVCDGLFPETMGRAYFWPVIPFYGFCRDYHLPGTFVARSDRTLYFSSYPALALIYWLPQLFVACLGGWIARSRTISRDAVLAPSDGR